MEAFIEDLIGDLEKLTPLIGETPTPWESDGAGPILLTFTCLLSEDNGAYEYLQGKEKGVQLIRLIWLLRRWLPAAASLDAPAADKEAADVAAQLLQVFCDRGIVLDAVVSPRAAVPNGAQGLKVERHSGKGQGKPALLVESTPAPTPAPIAITGAPTDAPTRVPPPEPTPAPAPDSVPALIVITGRQWRIS